MAGRDEPPGPDPDDWFDEPRVPPERRPRAPVDADQTAVVEDWLTGDEHERAGGLRVGGLELTNRQAVVAGSVVALVLLVIGLAAGGVFSSGSPSTAPPSTSSSPATSAAASTQPSPAPAVKGPTTTLKPGDKGAQVTALQRALAKLGYSPGKPDGVYGAATQRALTAFQEANNLAADGILGSQTLAALVSALSRTG
jgi:Putative peptidoglycan binding domain